MKLKVYALEDKSIIFRTDSFHLLHAVPRSYIPFSVTLLTVGWIPQSKYMHVEYGPNLIKDDCKFQVEASNLTDDSKEMFKTRKSDVLLLPF